LSAGHNFIRRNPDSDEIEEAKFIYFIEKGKDYDDIFFNEDKYENYKLEGWKLFENFKKNNVSY